MDEIDERTDTRGGRRDYDALNFEFEKRRLEDEDAQRDATRKMAWFSLVGLLVYPIGITATAAAGLDTAATLIADIAPTYFASIAVLVSALAGVDAIKGSKNS